MINTNALPEIFRKYKRKILNQERMQLYKKCITMLENNQEFMRYVNEWNQQEIDAYQDRMYRTVNYKMCCVHETYRLDKLKIFSRTTRETILDIGCGVGYFSWFAKQAGHTVFPLDAPMETCGCKIFIDGQKALGLDTISHTIQPFQPLPDLPKPCTLAVTFSPQFYNPSTDDFWREPEWRFFLKDLGKHMKVHGKIYFHMCQVESRPEFGPFGTRETKELFLSLGTFNAGYRVEINADRLKNLN